MTVRFSPAFDGTCETCKAVETYLSSDASNAFDNGGACDCAGEEEETELSENDRALQLLVESVHLFNEMNQGVLLSNRAEHLEKVAELTGVQPSILLFAYHHGVLRAHRLFIKKEFKESFPSKEQPKRCGGINDPAELSPPSVVSDYQ